MMVTESKKLCDVLKDIKDDKYVMPAFQRDYVWNLDRVEKLWDSILQGYPFSTFLFWELDQEHVTPSNLFYVFARSCNFKKNGDNKGCLYNSGHINFEDENHPTIAVLDGQQRLTSLFLSLYGEMWKEPRKGSTRLLMRLFIELDKSKIDENESFNTKKYDIYFTEKAPAISSPTLFEIKRIVNPDEGFQDKDTREIAIENVVNKVPARSKDYATHILNRLCEAFYDQELVVYTKISELSQDDALEMFVRFNSGGKQLSKAEISMSILEAYWNDVKRDFRSALVGSYANFGNDFILRTAHMIFGDVIKSNIDQDFTLSFKSNFDSFKAALQKTEDLFINMAGYDLSKFASRWNVIIPIIFLIYNNPNNYIESAEGLFAYLFRAILFNYYASGTTGKLQKMKTLIFENNFQLMPSMFENDEDLRVTPSKIDDLFFAEKDSTTVYNVLYCLGFNNIQSDYDYDQDHIHPASRFAASKPLGMSDNDWTQARQCYNKLANLQYLDSEENRSKGNEDFDRYYLSLNQAAHDKMEKEGFIPKPPVGMNPSNYYNIKNFLNFYNDRKTLLTNKIKDLLDGKW